MGYPGAYAIEIGYRLEQSFHGQVRVVRSGNGHWNAHGGSVRHIGMLGMISGDDKTASYGLFAIVMGKNMLLNAILKFLAKEIHDGQINAAIHQPE